MCLIAAVAVVDAITVFKVGYKKPHQRKLLHLHLIGQQFERDMLEEGKDEP